MNITLTIDEEVLRRARILALERRTSVNVLVRDFLESLVSDAGRGDALQSFLSDTDSTPAGSGPGGRTWTRDEVHER